MDKTSEAMIETTKMDKSSEEITECNPKKSESMLAHNQDARPSTWRPDAVEEEEVNLIKFDSISKRDI